MKKALNVVYILLFLCIVIIPLVFMNHRKDAVSELDNRVLAEFPALGDENFTGGIEQYISDRIGGRSIMLSAYSMMNDAVVGELAHPSYCYGQDGYVFFKMHKNVKYGAYHRAFAEMTRKLQTYCEERGTEFYLIFDPEKISVYRRYLPKGFYYNDDWVDEFCGYLDELGVKYVNNSRMLIKKSYSEQVFNRQYDAGHWNDLGCFYSTAALYELIRADHPEVPELTKDMFEITEKVEHYLPNSEIVVDETVPVFTLKTTWDDISSGWSQEIEVNPQFRHFHYYVNNAEGAEKLPRALIFQGSYFNRGPQFLISAASEDIGIHNYQNVINFDYYFNIFTPDIVILDVAEYVFSDNYFNSADMRAMDLKPGIIDSGKDFEAQKSSLLSSASKMDVRAGGDVVPGRNVDAVSVYVQTDDVKYAYLISDGSVYDLKTGEGVLSASVPHASLDGNVTLYIIGGDGSRRYADVELKVTENGTGGYSFTKNASYRDGVFTFTTDIDGNYFNFAHVQIMAGDGTYLMDTDARGTSPGSVSAEYTHGFESGWYIMRLKGNTNMQDEAAGKPMYLENGKTYFISFTIVELTDKKVVLKDFAVAG